MFKFLLFSLVITYVVAAPATDKEATVISNSQSDDGAGNFAYNFETSNSIKVDAKGNLKQLKDEQGKDAAGEVQTGSYSWTDANGVKYEIKWVADENGFQPQGDHLPVAPKAP